MNSRNIGSFAVTLVLCLGILLACGKKKLIEEFQVEGPISGSEFVLASSPAITISPDGEYVAFLVSPNDEHGLGMELLSLARSSGKISKMRIGDSVSLPQALVISPPKYCRSPGGVKTAERNGAMPRNRILEFACPDSHSTPWSSR